MLIAFEGIDGAGKSTQVLRIAHLAQREGYTTCIQKEPTTGHIGSLIRRVLRREVVVPDVALAALFAADRLDHLFCAEGLLQATRTFDLVLCDRYVLSSLAYFGPRLGFEFAAAINSLAISTLAPNISYFLDADPSICRARIAERGQPSELYESESDLLVTRQGFLEATSFVPYRVDRINANAPADIIAEEVWSYISMQLEMST